MYPPVGIGQIRVSHEDITLAGQLTLPAGTAIWVPHHALQNTSFNWDSPSLFLPGRALLCAVLFSSSPIRFFSLCSALVSCLCLACKPH